MNLPITLGYWILAVLPIGLLLFLMVKLQMAAYKAAPLSLLVTVFTGSIFFKAGGYLIVNELLKALWSASSIVLVVFTAILIYEVTNEAKAFTSLNQTLKKIAPNELIRVLGLGTIFVSFLQGVTGFGVPVAVSSPLLIAMGVSPIWSVVVALWGHAWAGTYGTLAVAWSALISESGISGSLASQAGFYAGIFLWILNLFGGLSVAWFYGKGQAIRKGFIAIIIFSTIQGGGQLLLGQTNYIIANFLPGCLALIAFVFISKLPLYNKEWEIKDSRIMERKEVLDTGRETSGMKLYEMFFPYLIMTSLTLALLLNPTIKAGLSSLKIGFSFPQTETGYGFINPQALNYSPFAPLSHPSTYLFISAISGYVFYRSRGFISRGSMGGILKRALKKTIPSSMAVISLTMMSKIMGGTGQVSVLAAGTARVLGKYYVFVAPMVGLLGCFITSSNMSSNILFANFQLSTAELLSLNPAAILGAQTAGAAIATTIAPGNVVLGTTTANIAGQEGKILKIILPIALSLGISFGLLLYILEFLI